MRLMTQDCLNSIISSRLWSLTIRSSRLWSSPYSARAGALPRRELRPPWATLIGNVELVLLLPPFRPQLPHELDTIAHTQASAGPTGPFSFSRPSCLIACLAVVVRCSLPLELITIAPRVTKNRQHHQPSVAYTRGRASCFSPVAGGAHAASRAFKMQKIQLVLKRRYMATL
jgi:hypothetical protein